MKKLLFLTSFLIFGIIGTSNAQVEEGTFVLGADIGSGVATSTSSGLFSFDLGLNEDSGYSIGISPKAGYFLSDGFLVGVIANVGYFNAAGDDATTANEFVYGFQGFTRFYVTPGEADLGDVVPTGLFFLEVNAGIAGVNIEDGPSTNGFAFGFGPGYSIFLNDFVGLEASLKYNGLTGAGNTDYQSSLGVNFGIKIFIPRSDAEDTINQF